MPVQRIVLNESKPKQVDDFDICGADVRRLLEGLEVEWPNLINVRDDGKLEELLQNLGHQEEPNTLTECSEDESTQLEIEDGMTEVPAKDVIPPIPKDPIYSTFFSKEQSGTASQLTSLWGLSSSKTVSSTPQKKMTLIEYEALVTQKVDQNSTTEDVNVPYSEPTSIMETIETKIQPIHSSVEDILDKTFKNYKSIESRVAEAIKVDPLVIPAVSSHQNMEIWFSSSNIEPYSAPDAPQPVREGLQAQPQLLNKPILQPNIVLLQNHGGHKITAPVAEIWPDLEVQEAQNQLTYQVVENFKNAQLQSEISNEELYYEAYRKTAQLFGNRTPPGTNWQFNIKQQLDSAFKCILHFQTTMDKAFEEKGFFQTQSQFETECSRLSEDVLNHYGDLGALASATKDKLTQLKAEYGRLHKEIRSTEERCGNDLLKKVLEYYIQEMNQTALNNLEEIKTYHETLSKKCVKGFTSALNCPNPEITQKLEAEVASTFEKVKLRLLQNLKTLKSQLDAVQNAALSDYKLKMERFINSPSFNNLDQLKKQQHSVSSTATQMFKEELKKIGMQVNGTTTTQVIRDFENLLQNIFKHLESDANDKLRTFANQSTYMTLRSSGPGSSKPSNGNRNANITQVERTTKDNSTPVGIHFSLKTLTVGIQREDTFAHIYGPEPNTVSIGDEVLIGREAEGTDPGVSKFNIKSIILNPSDGCFSDNGRRRFRIEVIIAFLLAKVHQITRAKLHTSKMIQYVIAIPTFFNSKLQNMMTTACEIAGIEATLVFETCALAVQLIRDEFLVSEDNQLFVAIEDKNLSCDISLYKITNSSRLTLTDISCADSSGYLRWAKDGITNAFSHFTDFKRTQVSKVGLSQSKQNRTDAIKQVHSLLTRIQDIVEIDELSIIMGASILARYRYDEKYSSFFNRKYLMSLEQLVSNIRPRGNQLATRAEPHWPVVQVNTIPEMKRFVVAELKRQELKLREKRETLQKKCLQKSQKKRSNKVSDELNKIQINIGSEGNSLGDLERLELQLNNIK